MKIYTIHDSKAEAFITPFFASNDNVAIRMFSSAANDPNHDFGRFSGDYTLFALGEFEPTTAKFKLDKTPTNLGLALIHKTDTTKTTDI